MAFDMYGKGALKDPLEQTFTGSYQTMEDKAKNLFSGKTGAFLRQKSSSYMRDTIMEGINAFGIDYIMNWDMKGEQVMKALTDDMKDATQQAIKARKMGDVAMYKQALQRKLFDRTMTQYADAMDKAKFGQILTGIIGGISSLVGNYMGQQAGKKAYQDFMDYVDKSIQQIQDLARNSPYQPFGQSPGL